MPRQSREKSGTGIYQMIIRVPLIVWMSDVGDKIGASLRYNFNPAFSVSLSVWSERRPFDPMPLYRKNR